MQHSTFNDLVNARQLKTCSVLLAKDKEYSSDTDRLHNFVVAGRYDGEGPGRALWGMWKKHIVSIQDCINRMEADPSFVPSKEWCDDKLGDNINYTHLLEGVIEDRRARTDKVVTDATGRLVKKAHAPAGCIREVCSIDSIQHHSV